MCRPPFSPLPPYLCPGRRMTRRRARARLDHVRARAEPHGPSGADRFEFARRARVGQREDRAGADQGALSVSGVTPQDICAVAPSASWVGYTASRILMDPGYLSPSDIENNFSPLHEMLGDGEIRTGMPARIVAPETQRKETVEARIETERTQRDVTARSQAAFKIAKAREEERRQALEDDMRRALSKDEESALDRNCFCCS